MICRCANQCSLGASEGGYLTDRQLPEDFLEQLDDIERSCLAEADPIRRSGFGGGTKRWRAEREPILDAVAADGDLLDIGCANGYLLECLVSWGKERGLELRPHGVDRSARLIELAGQRMPEHVANLHIANAWHWTPPRRYSRVYTLYDCVPRDYLDEYVERLLERVVASGGRLILGAYGSRSRNVPPFDVGEFLEFLGYRVVGRTTAGKPPVAMFAWIDKETAPVK